MIAASAVALAGCAPARPCTATLTATGAATAAWSSGTALECEGFGPSIDDSIDLYFRESFDELRIRVDFVVPGETGTFEDYFVAFTHQDDEWGSFDDVACTVTFDRNEHVGSAGLGFKLFIVEGQASCASPLAPFQSEGTVDIGTVPFAGWYETAG